MKWILLLGVASVGVVLWRGNGDLTAGLAQLKVDLHLAPCTGCSQAAATGAQTAAPQTIRMGG